MIASTSLALLVKAATPDGRMQTFRAEDTLEPPEVLPGFACAVADLFI